MNWFPWFSGDEGATTSRAYSDEEKQNIIDTAARSFPSWNDHVKWVPAELPKREPWVPHRPYEWSENLREAAVRIVAFERQVAELQSDNRRLADENASMRTKLEADLNLGNELAKIIRHLRDI